MARQKSAVLTDKQEAYVEGKLDGLSDHAASVAAGYNTRNQVVSRSKAVKEAISTGRAEIRRATTLNRLDVIDGILDAIDMARTMSEPGTMINGYDKLAKIIGAYEPEKVKVELSENGARLLKKMEAMSREELVMLSEGDARIVDGEFVRVN